MIFLLYAVIIAVLAIIIYFKRVYSHWKRKGIYQIESLIPFGNFYGFLFQRKPLCEFVLDTYREIKLKGVRHGGFYILNNPIYIPIDLEIVKAIMVKDFESFTDHGTYHNEKIEPLTENLFNLEGDEWKTLRAKLTPTFTSGKMKMMYPIFLRCAEGLTEMMSEYVDKSDPVDIREILARFTTDIIGNCAFGIDCNCVKNPDSEFRRYGKRTFQLTLFDSFCQLMTFLLPRSLMTFLGIRSMNKEVHEFFMGVVKNTVNHREQNGISRPDFLQLLIELKNQGYVKGDDNVENKCNPFTFTVEQLAAQCFIFFIAGYETSSTTMTFALYELAKNPDIQDGLRQEIMEVLIKHKDLTYEAIMEMKYLDRILQETLRKYPPLSATFRITTKDYKIPDTNVTLEKGTVVNIFIYGIHKDPAYYPDPEKFDPDRFTEENKSARPQFAWLPFGEGPRHCIGRRFGLLQSKVGIVTIIKNFRISLNKKTSTPLEMNPASFIMAAKGDIWFNVNKLEH